MKQEINLYKSEYYINRELSWLEFNERVLQETKDRDNPLFERIKFLAITASNLDEFFMVRVAALKDLVSAGINKADAAGLDPKAQLKSISTRAHKMVEDQYNVYNRRIIPSLKRINLRFLEGTEINSNQKAYLEDYFMDRIYPVLTPMAVDSGRPFPLIYNKTLNIAVLIKAKDSEDTIFATVQVPTVLPRLIKLPGTTIEECYILLEEVIAMHINRLFIGREIIAIGEYRITRNADLSLDEEEAEDLLRLMEKSLKKRKRGRAIRLEYQINMDDRLIKILKESLEIHKGDCFGINGPIDLTFLWKVYELQGYERFKYDEYIPKTPRDLLEEEDIWTAIAKEDILVHTPYESFEAVADFIRQASRDPQVLAIKQTLYRVSGNSEVVKALEAAAEAGKQVTVLVELKARFDEENNIWWAKRLEEAGCHVIYGLVGLKTHAKVILVVRREENGIKRYVHLSTGNYNDVTAKVYTDMGIFTSNEYYGADASAVFNMLTGYSQPPELYKLSIAPLNLRSQLLYYIDKEIKNAALGYDARIIIKVNSLSDAEIIAALYRASIAGVKIDLIVRGVCCLRPGILGISENIRVRSIVGRFLEHSRIYYFYNNGKEELFISSADLMSRNLDRRIELFIPIENLRVKERIINLLAIELVDTIKARVLTSGGIYKRIDRRGKRLINSQLYFRNLAENSIKHNQLESLNSGLEGI